MNCPKCGTAANPGAKFCGSCGYDLSSNNQEIVEKTTTETQNIQENAEQIVEPVVEHGNQIIESQVQENVGSNQQVVNTSQQQKNTGNSKIAIIVAIVAVIVVVAAILGIVFLMPSSEEKQEKEAINNMFNPDKLIKIKSDDKYGYINSKGKLVIKAQYENASDFYGDYAVVLAPSVKDETETTVYQIIDQKGKVKKEALISIEYLEETGMWIIDNELYNGSLKKVSPTNIKVEEADEGYFIWVDSKENTGGIMNIEGKLTYEYKFQSGENYISIEPSETDESLKENYCRVNVNNDKYAIVNCDTGVVVQDFTEKYISVEENNIFEINKINTYSDESIIYIQDDKIAYKSDDPSNISVSYYPGFLQIKDYSKEYDEGRYSYLHLDTLELKDKEPEGVSNDTNELNEWEKLTGINIITQNYKYGLSNEETIVLSPEWDVFEFIDVNLYKFLKNDKKDYIYAKKDDNWYLIDLSTKKTINEFKTTTIYQTKGTTFMHYTDRDTKDKKVFNILTGKTLNVSSENDLDTYSNYVTIKDTKNKTLKYYNTELELIYTENL